MSDTVEVEGPVVAVAAIIVNYNAGQWLTRCVKAALANAAITELVVVDNASTDQSVESLKQAVVDDRCRVTKLSANFGFGYAVNVGAASVAAPYILLLNPDCLLRPTTVEKLLVQFAKANDVAACGPVVLDSFGKEQRGSRRVEPTPMRAIARTFGQTADTGSGFDLHKTSLPDQPEVVDAVSGSCMLIRKSTFDAISGMDERFFLHCEDLDLCRRIRDLGQRVVFVPSTSVIHLQGGSGRNLKVEWYKHRSMLMYHNKHAATDTGAAFSLLLKLGVWIRFVAVAMPLSFFSTNRDETAHDLQQLIATNEDITVVVDGSYCASAHAMASSLVQSGRRVLLVRTRFSKAVNRPAIESADIGADVSMATLTVVSDEYLKKVSAADIGRVRAMYCFAPLSYVNELFSDLVRLRVSRLVAVALAAKPSLEYDEHRRICDTQQDKVLKRARDHGIELSILRPTLLYGANTRSAIDRMCYLVKHLPVIPLLGDGSGLRQPLHIRDLVAASLNATATSASVQRSYCLGGDQRLTHAELLQQIAARYRSPVRIYELPVSVAKTVKRLLNWLGLDRSAALNLLVPEKRDILCDNDAAKKDIAFKPGKLELP